MSADDEGKPIPKEFLCRRCNDCGSHLRPDGLVDCQNAETPVVPVERRVYQRFESCPQRADFNPIPSHKLPLLAAFARRLKRRDGPEIMESRLESAYAVVRADVRTMARIKR